MGENPARKTGRKGEQKGIEQGSSWVQTIAEVRGIVGEKKIPK